MDVIIPVYRGYDDTLACIHSVLSAKTQTSFELVVIDDCSPERRLSEMLTELAARGLFTYLRNGENLGFVRTCNRGMSLHQDRDVLLLNSDTVVYNDWLDRIRAAASPRDVGTVTPLSTNATICSYPIPNRVNNERLEIDYPALDNLCSTVNVGESIEVPTAVGFCMYIRRDCLDDLSRFREAVGDSDGLAAVTFAVNDFPARRNSAFGHLPDCQGTEANEKIDPTDACLWHYRLQRLEAEPIWDSILAAAVAALREIDYHGPATLELSRHGHMAVEAARCAVEFFRPLGLP